MDDIMIGCPVRDREWILPKYLDSIYALSYPKENICLCFIVNDSTDNTLERLLIRGFKLIRQTSLTVNSIEPISLNMVNTLISDIQELCHDLPCKIFTCEEGQVPDFNLSGLCILFKLKIFLSIN